MTAAPETAPDDSTGATGARHVPVLLGEMLQCLAPSAGDLLIDGTFGAGGYSRALLASAPNVRVLAIERDPDARTAGADLARISHGRLILAGGRFSDMAQIAQAHGFLRANAVVLDVGVSSMQLDEPERGFSFLADGPLDMRMERSGPSAADIVNRCGEPELADLIFDFGEERHSRRIARAIVKAREAGHIMTTAELARIVERAIGRHREVDRHPATRTFQALRIAANDELAELARGLQAAEAILAPGGRLVVVTFHSLEDRIVKRFLSRRSGRGGSGSRHAPPAQGAAVLPSFRLVNPSPVTPTDAEIRRNPRARSAKLRAAIRTEAAAWQPEAFAELGVPDRWAPFRHGAS